MKIDDITLRFLNCSENLFSNYYTEQSEFYIGETDYNNFSLVVEVTHESNKILFTGDISTKAQEILASSLGKCDLLKCQHHSIDTYINDNFFKTISPNMAVCSINIENVAPPKSALTKYLVSRGIPYYVTAQSSNIKIISDGFKLHCSNNPYITTITMQRMLQTFNVENLYYYGFGDIGNYNENTNLVDMINLMKNGSIALVNFLYNYNVTPSFVSTYGAIGFIQKASDTRAIIFLKDSKPNIDKLYIGEYYQYEGYIDNDKVTWKEINFSQTDWTKVNLTSSFLPYTTTPDTTPIYKKNGNVVTIKGSVKPNGVIQNSSTKVEICTLPSEFRPSNMGVSTICQCSGNSVWLLSVETDGKVMFSRYRIGDTLSTITGSEWLSFNITYMV